MEIIVVILLVVPSLFVAGYHFVLGVLGLFLTRKPRFAEQPKSRFAILIPAHNEERDIASTILKLKNDVDYPGDLYHIFVIADNCSDRTAEIAENSGAHVLRRHNTEQRGKGFALCETIPIVLRETGCDGILIIDADSSIDSHALRSLDYRVQRNGNHALQFNNVTNNPDASTVSYLLSVANCLENDFFYAGKDWCQLFVLLRGTGMYLPQPILERFPWEAFSIVEDTDYSLQLMNANIPIHFMREGRVLSEFPAERETLAVQRNRWIGGTIVFSLLKSLPLIISGVCRFSPRCIDAGITLLVLSRPAIIMQLLLTTFCAALLAWPLRSEHGISLFAISICCWCVYFLYFWCGVFRLGITRKRLTLLAALPFEVLAYVWLAIRTILKGPQSTWDRTPRS